ncbi:MAG: hypothetical protein WAT35_06210 [Tabrizicola sp.]|uniref:hypothetical protein n=1 Tax=Tabrizicola sp. TaxID=2005166 RepID=UPI003BB02AA4
MALRLVSLILLLPVTLVNLYWASGLERNVAYIAARSDGRCSMIGWLEPFSLVLPWVFLALGVGSAIQLVLQGRFGFSAVLLALHVAHLALLLALLVLGNSYCSGVDLWPVVRILSGPLGFGFVVMLLPVPILAMQMAAMRKVGGPKDGAP